MQELQRNMEGAQELVAMDMATPPALQLPDLHLRLEHKQHTSSEATKHMLGSLSHHRGFAKSVRSEWLLMSTVCPSWCPTPWLPLKRKQLSLIPHVILQSSSPVLLKPSAVQQLWAERSRLRKCPSRRSSLNLKRLLRGEKMELFHSLQALCGKGLQ